METITLDSLKNDITFSGDLLIDSNFLLLPKQSPVTDELIKALREWEFQSLLCDGGVSFTNQIDAPAEEEPVEQNPDGSDTTAIGESVKKAFESSKSVVDNSDNTRMEMVQKVYDEYMNYIEQVLTHYTTHKQINQTELSDTVKELCIFIKENKRFILRVNPSKENSSKNFLIKHSMRTTVLAVAIALQLHMPLSKMVELGVTCILHEIGMLRLPPQIYMTEKKLTPGEKVQIFKHPLFGYSIAKDLNFPISIQLGILEHHEKENGTGYPRKLTGDKINTIAKIISVACSYEAITAPRTYKDERSEFEAIIELLKNANKQYDDSVIKALLYTVSLYPIGAYVYLSNRKIGIVVDTNPDNPKCPVVQLLTEKNEDGSQITVQTKEGEVTIVRILTKREKEDIIKLVDEKYKVIREAQAIAQAINALPPQPKPINRQPSPGPDTTDFMEEVDINIFS
ncbi:MAG: HD-GYP domain-containing protein [Treponema sp.]|nr:HD-GYP domain-containing protein [Treponema sp.]MCR5436361.1 HD-GYP domain-containing protein [Treponema sp.]